jgi:hypothetical protein
MIEMIVYGILILAAGIFIGMVVKAADKYDD